MKPIFYVLCFVVATMLEVKGSFVAATSAWFIVIAFSSSFDFEGKK
jgi:hypothetical protein